jgi:3-oxoadipate enol-lactonase
VTSTHAGVLWHLVEHLGLESIVLVGLSMGGQIVLEATLGAPRRTRALVLLDALLDGVPWDVESRRGMKAIPEGLRSSGIEGSKAAWLQHGFFEPARRKAEVAERLRQMVDDYSGLHWTQADPHGPHPDALALLPTIETPVVVGELDVPCFIDMADVLAGSIPKASKVVVPDSGHMVNMEAPSVVNALLRDVISAADA